MTRNAFITYGLSDYSRPALEVIFDTLDDSFKDDYSDDELDLAFSCVKDCFTEIMLPVEEAGCECWRSSTNEDVYGRWWSLTNEDGRESVLFEHSHS